MEAIAALCEEAQKTTEHFVKLGEEESNPVTMEEMEVMIREANPQFFSPPIIVAKKEIIVEETKDASLVAKERRQRRKKRVTAAAAVKSSENVSPSKKKEKNKMSEKGTVVSDKKKELSVQPQMTQEPSKNTPLEVVSKDAFWTDEGVFVPGQSYTDDDLVWMESNFLK